MSLDLQLEMLNEQGGACWANMKRRNTTEARSTRRHILSKGFSQ